MKASGTGWLVRCTIALSLIAITGCRTDVKWAIRIPQESRDCTRTCEGAPDEPKWRECIAACGGEVKEGWCDGTMFNPVSPEGCRQAETTKFSVGGTIVLVVLLVVGGSVILGGLAARKP